MKNSKRKAILTIEEFKKNYYYATELRALAKELGIQGVSQLRKDKLESKIEQLLQNGRADSNSPRTKPRGPADSASPLTLNRQVQNYKNDSITKDFIEAEAKRKDPHFKRKSGSRYWLNRWRENAMESGKKITYGDLVSEYVRLNKPDHKNPQIPSTKFNNFISDYLKAYPGSSKKTAVEEWEKLKHLPIEKDLKAYQDFLGKKRNGA